MSGPGDWRDWIPIRMYWTPTGPWLDWCLVGKECFTDPFFDHNIDKLLRDPFRLLFRRQEPLAALLNRSQDEQPAAQPGGFIFHMSRCGSTLASQLLATVPGHFIVSEASIFESLLSSRSAGAELEQRVAWLRAIVGAMHQAAGPGRSQLFVKFDAWHTIYLPLIRHAFPTVPWIFLYRDPAEVLVSLSQVPGGRMQSGRVDPRELGLDPMSAFDLDPDQYRARILARICDAAVTNHTQGQSHFVNYLELPEFVEGFLPDFFDFACTSETKRQMRQRARFDGKDAGIRFQSDREQKRRRITDTIRHAAALLNQTYEDMEAIRRQRDQGFGPAFPGSESGD